MHVEKVFGDPCFREREREFQNIPRKKICQREKIHTYIYIFPGGVFLITRLTRDFDRAKKKKRIFFPGRG